MQKSRVRLILALVVLGTSLVMLAWSFLPGERILRRQIIEPTEMQLPTPASFGDVRLYLATLDHSREAARANHDADCFALFSPCQPRERM